MRRRTAEPRTAEPSNPRLAATKFNRGPHPGGLYLLHSSPGVRAYASDETEPIRCAIPLAEDYMATYRLSTHVKAPPERVFDLWTDLDRAPEWIEGLTKITDRTGPADQKGARYTSHFGSMKSPTEVLDVERPRFIRTRFGSVLLRGETEATFEPEGDGTRIVQVFHTQGVIPANRRLALLEGLVEGQLQGRAGVVPEARRTLIDRSRVATPRSCFGFSGPFGRCSPSVARRAG